MPVVRFEPRDHSYFVDERRVPSVTQILDAAGLCPDYSRIPPAVLAHARERGAHVDLCCDLHDAGDLDWDSVHPEALPYVRAWQRFRDRERFVPVHSQGVVYHPELDYAGSFDGFGLIGNAGTLVDRKCTSKLSDTYALQLALYGMPGIGLACDETPGELMPLTVARRLVVQLRNDADYRLYDCDVEAKRAGRDDYAAARGAVAVAKWRGLTNGNGKR